MKKNGRFMKIEMPVLLAIVLVPIVSGCTSIKTITPESNIISSSSGYEYLKESRISYPYVIWLGAKEYQNDDLILYNIETGVSDVIKEIAYGKSEISGGNIFFRKDTGGYMKPDGLWMYNIQSKQESSLYAPESYDFFFDVSDEYIGFSDKGSIYYLNINDKQPVLVYDGDELTDDSGAYTVRFGDIDNNNMVFTVSDKMFAYNIDTGTTSPVGNHDYEHLVPTIFRGNVAYYEQRGGSCIIDLDDSGNFVKKCTKEVDNYIVVSTLSGDIIKEIKSNGIRMISMNERYVLYDESEGSDIVIHGYDILNGEPFRFNLGPGSKAFPRISEDYVVYQDLEDGILRQKVGLFKFDN